MTDAIELLRCAEERFATAPRHQQVVIDNLPGVGTREWLFQASRILNEGYVKIVI